MNVLGWVLKCLTLAPFVVQAIQEMHANLPNEAKKDLAMDALSIATGAAKMLDPAHTEVITAANALASNVIDGSVAVLKAAGAMQPSSAAAPDPHKIAQVAASAAAASSEAPRAPVAAPAPAAPAPPAPRNN